MTPSQLQDYCADQIATEVDLLLRELVGFTQTHAGPWFGPSLVIEKCDPAKRPAGSRLDKSQEGIRSLMALIDKYNPPLEFMASFKAIHDDGYKRLQAHLVEIEAHVKNLSSDPSA